MFLEYKFGLLQTEVYSGKCQTYETKPFVKIVNN